MLIGGADGHEACDRARFGMGDPHLPPPTPHTTPPPPPPHPPYPAYPTLPNPNPALPFPTDPSTLPYPTLPCPPLPYPTLPYPTLPFPLPIYSRFFAFQRPQLASLFWPCGRPHALQRPQLASQICLFDCKGSSGPSSGGVQKRTLKF